MGLVLVSSHPHLLLAHHRGLALLVLLQTQALALVLHLQGQHLLVLALKVLDRELLQAQPLELGV